MFNEIPQNLPIQTIYQQVLTDVNDGDFWRAQATLKNLTRDQMVNFVTFDLKPLETFLIEYQAFENMGFDFLKYCILSPKLATLLLQGGANPDILSKGIFTKDQEYSKELYLNLIISNYNTELFFQTLKLNPDVNYQQTHYFRGLTRGLTLLQMAIIKQNMEAVEALLDRGADPRICNHQGKNSLMTAAIKFPKAIPLLFKHSASIVEKGGDPADTQEITMLLSYLKGLTNQKAYNITVAYLEHQQLSTEIKDKMEPEITQIEQLSITNIQKSKPIL